MNYSNLIKQAAQITWRYKFLWFFGIMMALCGQGGGGRAQFQVRLPFNPSGPDPQFPSFFPEPLGQTPIWIYIVAGIIFFIIFGIISLIVGAIGRSALIKSADRIENGEPIGFGQSWRDGLSKIVPLGLLQALLYSPLVIIGAIFIIIFFTQFWPFFSQLVMFRPPTDPTEPPPFVDDLFALFPLFFITICGGVCIFFILQLIIGLFLTFGSRAIVLENRGVLNSFSRSWSVFRQNMGSTIVLAILMVVIGFVVSFIVGIPGAIIMLPLMMSTMPAMMSETGPALGDYVLLGAAGIVIALIFGVVGGIVQVFFESLWTLAYREFVRKAG
jgi:hypothetical protein